MLMETTVRFHSFPQTTLLKPKYIPFFTAHDYIVIIGISWYKFEKCKLILILPQAKQ